MTDTDRTIEQLSALAHATRFAVFRTLMAEGPAGLPAGTIADQLGVAPNLLSAHLSVLSRAGLVSMRREGRRIIYSPEISAVTGMIAALVEDCCQGHPEVCSPLQGATVKC